MLCSLPSRNSLLISGVVISHLLVLHCLLSGLPDGSTSPTSEVLIVSLAGESISSSLSKKIQTTSQKNTFSSKESRNSIQASEASSLVGAEGVSHLTGGGPARQAIHSPRPHYPLMSRKLREQGLVMVRLCVNEQGIVGEVDVSKSSGFQGLDQSALKALSQWRFTPIASSSNSLFLQCFQTPIQFTLEG